jgi:4-amino-4-deoxy-L-arabinose transferase-like glycosyltransferase
LTVLVWLFVIRRPGLIRRLLWWPGLVLFLAIAGPWFVAMQLRFPDFFDYFVMEQHFRRFAGSGFNNAHPFWFYVPVLALITLPWSPWLVMAWKRRRGRLPSPPVQASRALMWIWVAVIVGFFSLPSSKLVGYVLGALPPLAWLVADAAFAPSLPGRHGAAAWRTSGVVAIVACLCAAGALARFQPTSAGPMAAYLVAAKSVAEPVVMLDRYTYDLGFSSRLDEPVQIVSNWRDPAIATRDNWRKEMFDAGRFAPSAASRLLIDKAQLQALVCNTPVTWLVGSKALSGEYPVLNGLSPVSTSGDLALWKVLRPSADATSRCQGMPNVGPLHK